MENLVKELRTDVATRRQALKDILAGLGDKAIQESAPVVKENVYVEQVTETEVVKEEDEYVSTRISFVPDTPEYKNLWKACSTDSYRPSMQGIFIKDNKCVATNSFILSIADKNFEDAVPEEGVIVPVDAWKSWHKHKKNTSNMMVFFDDHCLVLFDYVGTERFEVTVDMNLYTEKDLLADLKKRDVSYRSFNYIDETYPPYETALPEDGDLYEATGFNSAYIEKLMTMHKFVYHSEKFRLNRDASKPSRIETNDYDDRLKLTSIIMPVRLQGDDKEVGEKYNETPHSDDLRKFVASWRRKFNLIADGV